MIRLFAANFHFEHALDDRRPAVLPRALKRIDDELACLWAATARDGDFILRPPGVEDTLFDSLRDCGLADVRSVSTTDEIVEPVELCPWGWTDDVCLWARERRFHFDAPEQEIVRKFNSRRFSFKSESDWSIGLTQSTLIASVANLQNAIAAFPAESPWVVKAEFGMSARERCLGRGPTIDESTANWAAKRLKHGGVLFLEPWVEKLAEAGLQFDVPKSGPIRLLGITPLLTDTSGRYRGSRFNDDPSLENEWSAAIETGLRLCELMRAEAYFGPVGIDAVRYLDRNGDERTRPLQDVNARWTMGRLSLGLRRLLQPGETGEWRHLDWPTHDPAAPQIAYDEFVDTLPANVKAIRTSPFVIDDQPVRHGSVVLIASEHAIEPGRAAPRH